MNPQPHSSSESEGSDNEDSLKIHHSGNQKSTSLSVKEEAKKAHSVGQETLSSSLNVKRPLHQDDQDVEDAQIGGHIQNTVKKRLPSEGLNVKVLSSASSQRQTENSTDLKPYKPPINKGSGFKPPYNNLLAQTTTTTTTSSSYKKDAPLTPQTLHSEINKPQAKRKEKFKPPYNNSLTQISLPMTTSSSYKKDAALTPQTLDSEINKPQAKKKKKFKPPYNNSLTQTVPPTTATSNTLNVKDLKSEGDHAEDVSYQREEEKEYEDTYHEASLQTIKMGEEISTQDSILFSPEKNLASLEAKEGVPSKKLILEKSSKINPPQQPAIQKQTSISSFEKAMAYLEETLASSMTITNETVSQNTRVERVFQALQTHIENTILTEEFIEDVYTCLFESDLAPFSEEHLNTDMTFTRPHPVHVIYSLANCLRALPKNTHFLALIEEAKSYLANLWYKEQQKGIELFPISEFLQKSTNATLIKSVNECPLYTATEWLGSDNRNPVFILRAQDFKPKWVFKPINIQPVNIEEANRLANTKDCEHFAFKMNFHEQFPIPAVFLIELRGVKGTIQPFIPGAIRFNKIPRDKRMSILPSLQKLLIFDLLFLNHDRNQSNILYRKEGDSYTCYGIDHEQSLKYQKGAFTMDQIDLIQELSPGLKFTDFNRAAKKLFLEESCNKYLEILQECFNNEKKLGRSHKSDEDLEMEDKMLNHMVNVGKMLRESTESFRKTVKDIKKIIKLDKTITNITQSNTDESFLPD
ncbi:hypothetical protein [Rhabdochlamydiaceae symbiont of Dictyostelium giganteum]|uniref:hypothetical protein n=1 Tax=Rhabdochlamydiaceae symbiont of Dictyostelium giganteum TaxID=3342349 RepID=UPI00384B3822